MKEFTLNADFGMTASDDGFALYGIHTGDMENGGRPMLRKERPNEQMGKSRL